MHNCLFVYREHSSYLRVQTGTETSSQGQKKIGKETELQPLMRRMDDCTGVYDTSTSLWQILEQNKVDLSWISNWIAWLPDVCKEPLYDTL